MRSTELFCSGSLNGVCIHDAGLVVPIDTEGPTPAVAAIQAYRHIETGLDGSFGVFLAFL
jgi:hypothetical protein